jgi:DNA polymerase sigma
VNESEEQSVEEREKNARVKKQKSQKRQGEAKKMKFGSRYRRNKGWLASYGYGR